MDTKNGTIIDGRYEFVSTLGKGTVSHPSCLDIRKSCFRGQTLNLPRKVLESYFVMSKSAH